MFSTLQKFLHKHGRLCFAVIAAVIVLPFVFWGTTGVDRRPRRPIGTIQGKPVPEDEFSSAYLGVLLDFELFSGRRADSAQLRDLLSDRAWSRLVILRKARELGVEAPMSLVASQIHQMPMFVNEAGTFDLGRYNSFGQYYLAQYQLTIPEFEALLRNSLTVNIMQRTVGAAAHVTQPEMEQQFSRLFERFDVQVFQVRQPAADADLEPTPEEVQAYFELNREEFRVAQQRRVDYVLLPFGSYTNRVEITEERLRDYFDRNQEKYRPPAPAEQPAEATPPAIPPFEEVRAKIESDFRGVVSQRLAAEDAQRLTMKLIPRPGDPIPDFAPVVAELFTDQTVTVQSTPLFQSMTAVAGMPNVPELRREAFRLTSTSPYSDPLQTPDGFYILRLAEVKESYLPEFEEAQQGEKVTARLRQQKRSEAIEQHAMAAREALRVAAAAGEDLAAKATELGADLQAFTDVTAFEQVPGLRQFSQVQALVTSMEPGEFSEVQRGFPGVYFFTLLARKPADPAALAAQRDRLSGTILQQEQAALINDWVGRLMQEFNVVRNDLPEPPPAVESPESDAPAPASS